MFSVPATQTSVEYGIWNDDDTKKTQLTSELFYADEAGKWM